MDNSTNYLFGLTAEEFLDKDIFDLLNVKNISQEEKEKLLKKMLDNIQMRVIVRIDDMLDTSEKQAEFKKVLTLSEKEISEFFEKENIDIEALLVQEALIYKTELVSLANHTA